MAWFWGLLVFAIGVLIGGYTPAAPKPSPEEHDFRHRCIREAFSICAARYGYANTNYCERVWYHHCNLHVTIYAYSREEGRDVYPTFVFNLFDGRLERYY